MYISNKLHWSLAKINDGKISIISFGQVGLITAYPCIDNPFTDEMEWSHDSNMIPDAINPSFWHRSC